MAVASKVFKTINISCHEFIHPWVASCSDANSAILTHALKASFRIYFNTYMVISLFIIEKKLKFIFCI